MSYSRLLKFGNYTFPAGFGVAQIERGRTIGSQKLARAHGTRQTSGYRNGIRVVIRGGFYGGPLDTSVIRDRLDLLRAALAGGPDKLWLYDDRYYRCCEAISEPETFGPTGFDRIDDLEITLIGPDAVMFDGSAGGTHSQTWDTPGPPISSGTLYSIAAGGNALAWPVLTVLVSGSGAQTISYTIENTQTGESFTLAGSVTGGDEIVVDCLLKTVKIGSTDRRDLFEGLFMSLDPSVVSQNISNTQTTWTIDSINFAWSDRWE